MELLRDKLGKTDLNELKEIHKQIIEIIRPVHTNGPKGFLLVFPRRCGKTHLLQQLVSSTKSWTPFFMTTSQRNFKIFSEACGAHPVFQVVSHLTYPHRTTELEECFGELLTLFSILLIDDVDRCGYPGVIEAYEKCVLNHKGIVVLTTSDATVERKGYTRIVLEDKKDDAGCHHYNFSTRETLDTPFVCEHICLTKTIKNL